MRHYFNQYKYILITLGIVAIAFAYAYYQAQNIINGPSFTLDPVSDISRATNPVIHIAGTAQHTSELFLDNRKIFMDEDGHFEEVVLLSDGYNIIELSAYDRFDRMSTRELSVVLKQ